MEEYIAVDLDGTLAEYYGWKGVNHIGEPITPMVDRVKRWLAAGKKVKIFTARISDGQESTRKLIEDWTERYIGERLEVTNIKDYGMLLLFDDRAVQVKMNTGKLIGIEEEWEERIKLKG